MNTVSNLINAVSTNATTISTNVNTVSNLLNAVSTNATTISTNVNTVSNLLNAVSTNATTISTNVNTVSNTVNYLLTVSNKSSVTISTSYGFFSTISAGTIYGRFIGDASLLTNIPNNGAVLTVSNNVTTVSNLLNAVSTNATTISTNVNTVSNLLNAVSTNATTISTNVNTISNLLNAVSTNATTISTNVDTVSNRVNYLLTVSNKSSVTISTSYGFFSTISAGTVYGKFIGDGSLLTGITGVGAYAVPPTLSTNILSTGILNASNISTVTISTNAGYASSFVINTLTASTTIGLFGTFSTLSTTQLFASSIVVNSLMIGGSLGYINMGDIVTTSLSTIIINTGSINATGMSTTFGFFSTISAGSIYGKFVGDGSGLTGIASGMSALPPILSTTLLSTGILTASNISAAVISTNYGFFSTLSSGSIYGKFIGDASLLTNIPNNGAVLTVSNNVTTVSNLLNAVSTNATSISTNVNTISNLLNAVSTNATSISTNVNTISNTVNYLLTVSNISAFTLSTTYGFFSTLSSGSIYGKHIGDASLLTNIPNNGAVLTVSNNVTTISNLLNAVSTNATSISTNLNTVSNLLNAVSTNATTISTNVNTVSNLLNAVSTNATTISTNVNTISNTVNYLLTVSNISAFTLSTTYGFFSTLSSGSIYGKHIGDASLLTNIPNNGAVLTVSNNVTTVSNLLNAVSTNVTSISTNVNYLLTISSVSAGTMSTSYGFFSTISAGNVYGKFYGDGSQLTGITSVGAYAVPPILSTNFLSTGLLTASNISVVTISTNAGSASSFYINKLTTSTVSALLGSFSSLSVSQVYISSLTVDNLTIGSDNGYINMGDVIATSISTILVTTANIVAVNISTTSMSTNFGFFSTISAGVVYGKFVGDGSGLTGITGSGGLSYIPPILSTTLLSTGLLTASNISTATISTNYGFFSTLSSGTVYGKHIGDGSGLTNLTTSSLSLSSGNISISTITLMDTTNSSTGTIFERSSLLYFNTFVIGGSYVWQSQLISGS